MDSTLSPPARGQFVARAALLMSMVALSIDAMLPALPAMATSFDVPASDAPLILSTLFVGLAVGQLVFGPLSDSIGRRPAILTGLALFIAGSLVAMLATSYAGMLAGRVLQGFGAAGPRVVVVALVRDEFEGRELASVMSLVMTLFVLVPAVAPALGQAVLAFTSWHGIFVAFVVVALASGAWVFVGQRETLPPRSRRPFTLYGVATAFAEVVRQPATRRYTLVSALVMSAFLGFLGSAQPVLQTQYALEAKFALAFAVLAGSLGVATLVNSRAVLRFGMLPVVRLAAWTLLVAAAVFAPYAWLHGGHPPLAAVIGWLLVTFPCVGLLFANLNALAMQPLGHVAGAGATLIGTASTLIAVPLGTAIAMAYDGTVLPMAGGFVLFGLLTVLLLPGLAADEQD